MAKKETIIEKEVLDKYRFGNLHKEISKTDFKELIKDRYKLKADEVNYLVDKFYQ